MKDDNYKRQNKIDKFYSDLRNKHKVGLKCIKTSGATLPYNIYYTNETDAYIEVAIAGYSRDDISVHRKGDVLSISTSYDSIGVSEPEQNTDLHYNFKSNVDDTDPLNNVYYMYKGITNKQFNMNFLIPVGHQISFIDIDNGVLKIRFNLTDSIWAETYKLF